MNILTLLGVLSLLSASTPALSNPIRHYEADFAVLARMDSQGMVTAAAMRLAGLKGYNVPTADYLQPIEGHAGAVARNIWTGDIHHEIAPVSEEENTNGQCSYRVLSLLAQLTVTRLRRREVGVYLIRTPDFRQLFRGSRRTLFATWLEPIDAFRVVQ